MTLAYEPMPEWFGEGIQVETSAVSAVVNGISIAAFHKDNPEFVIRYTGTAKSDMTEVIRKLSLSLWIQREEALRLIEDGDWATVPQSISEIKADREQSSKHLRPRDPATIFLRDLDNGIVDNEAIDIALVAWRSVDPDGEGHTAEYILMCKDSHAALGVIQDISSHILEQSKD